MRLEVTPLKESNFWLIKRQNDSVPGLVILIALTTMSLIPLLPLPSLITLTLGILPRSDSIMIS
jgi:hypothetical protein